MRANFLLGKMQDKRHLSDSTLKNWKKKYQCRILYPVHISLKNKSNLKTFSDIINWNNPSPEDLHYKK